MSEQGWGDGWAKGDPRSGDGAREPEWFLAAGHSPHDPVPPVAEREGGGWGPVLLASMVVTLLCAAIVMLISVPFVVLQPGPVRNTLGSSSGHGELITVPGRTTYPTEGELDLTTVSVYGGPSGSVSLFQAMEGWLRHDRAIYPEELLYPKGQTAQEAEQESQAQMADSQSQAKAAALRELGHEVPRRFAISSVLEGSPARDLLKAGDVVLAVDGLPVADAEAIRTRVRAHPVGDAASPVVIRVRRGSAERDEAVVPVKGDDGQPAIRVLLEERFDFPFDVQIKIDDIGGPSAGTMFALGIVDKLTPGAMTGGRTIAGTGTIDADGNVGDIGGIQQKVVGARNHGARWFLAPAGNCAELAGHVPGGMTAYRIGTLHEARQIVEEIGRTGRSDAPRCG